MVPLDKRVRKRRWWLLVGTVAILAGAAVWLLRDHISYERPLHVAARDGDTARVRRLLDEGATVDVKDGIGMAPLHYAAMCNVEMVQMLLARGANVHAIDNGGNTPALYAVSSGHWDIVELLLNAGMGANEGSRALPLLSTAIGNNRPEIVKLLLDKGADPNREGVLYSAVSIRNPAIIELLLDKGADPNKTGSGGRTVLHEAVLQDSASEKDAEIVKMLLRKGAKPNLEDWSGRTPLELTGNHELQNILIQYGGKAGSHQDRWPRRVLWTSLDTVTLAVFIAMTAVGFFTLRKASRKGLCLVVAANVSVIVISLLPLTVPSTTGECIVANCIILLIAAVAFLCGLPWTLRETLTRSPRWKGLLGIVLSLAPIPMGIQFAIIVESIRG